MYFVWFWKYKEKYKILQKPLDDLSKHKTHKFTIFCDLEIYKDSQLFDFEKKNLLETGATLIHINYCKHNLVF